MNHLKNNLLPSIRAIAKLFIGIPLTVLALIFIGRLVINAASNKQFTVHRIDLGALIISMLCLTFFFILKALLWNLILKKNDIRIDAEKSLFIYSHSELRRYIPGNIFSFVSRANLLSKEKIPVKKTVTCMAIEAIILVFSAAITSIPAIFFLNHFASVQIEILAHFNISGEFFLITALITLFFCIFILYCYKKFIDRFQLNTLFFLKYKELLLFSIGMWIVYGIGNYFAALTITYLDPALFIQFCALFVAAWLIGYISFIFPMGLGIREGVVTTGLGAYGKIATPVAAFTSIISRVILVFSELISVVILYIANNNRHKVQGVFKRTSVQSIILFLATSSYIIYFSYVSIEKYNNFFSGRFDLGNMAQTVWNTIHGRIFMLTNPDSTNIVSRLGTHADFLLIVISPLYLIWEDPRMLLLLQTVCIGLGAIFVYLLSQKVLNNKTLSLLFGISYLLNPWIQRQNLYDFHSVSLATTFLLGTFYFLLIKRKFWFFIFLILSVLTKENIFLIAALLGIYIAIRGNIKLGTGIACISGIAFYLLIAKFIPQARGSAHFALSYYTDLGDSPSSIAKSILFNPLIIIPKIITASNISYLSSLLISAGFLSLFSPFYLFFAAPELLIYLLSNNNNMRSMNFHYGAAIVPFIYISAIFGTRFLLSQQKIRIKPAYIAYYLTAVTFFTAWNFGVLPGARYPSLEVFTQKLQDRKVISQFLDSIPEKYSVAATNNIGAHLSHREKIYTIPNGIDQADIVIFLLNDQFAQPSLTVQEQMVEKLSVDPTYTNVFEDDPFIVFTKKKVHGLEVNF